MAVARPYGFKIDFLRNPISGSAARFFDVILKFIFPLINEIKIFKKSTSWIPDPYFWPKSFLFKFNRKKLSAVLKEISNTIFPVKNNSKRLNFKQRSAQMTVKFENEVSSVAIRVNLLICSLKYR